MIGKKKPHPEITKMGYTDLKFNSLTFGWLALPNLCIFNEVEGGWEEYCELHASFLSNFSRC